MLGVLTAQGPLVGLLAKNNNTNLGRDSITDKQMDGQADIFTILGAPGLGWG